MEQSRQPSHTVRIGYWNMSFLFGSDIDQQGKLYLFQAEFIQFLRNEGHNQISEVYTASAHQKHHTYHLFIFYIMAKCQIKSNTYRYHIFFKNKGNHELFQYTAKKLYIMNSEDLLEYYRYFYPYNTLVKWLTYNGKYPLNLRELSFEYEGGIVQRYVTFSTAGQMKKRMSLREENVPRKVDAGAIFSERPQKDNKGQYTVQRQLIFDIDMDDYDDVRNCCQGKNVCFKCWKLLKIAIEIITKTLEQDFGFEKFMCVYSGRRGIHVWVCDQQARFLKDSSRKAIVQYLQLITGNSKADSLLADNVLMKVKDTFKEKDTDRRAVTERVLQEIAHPHVLRSLSILKKHFLEIFLEQKALEKQKGRDIVAKILKLRSEELKNNVENRWRNTPNDTQQLYQQLLQELKIYEAAKNDDAYKNTKEQHSKVQRVTFIEEEIQLAFLYPRMDHNVSTMKNHLLKLPFSVHPTTKNISVPLFAEQLNTFLPEDCITLQNLINQLASLQKQSFDFVKNENEVVKQSIIYGYIRQMEEFCKKL